MKLTQSRRCLAQTASGWAVQTKDKINLSASRGVAVYGLSFAKDDAHAEALRDEYSETDLEDALIRHLETFLLELGNDFAFIGRQRRLRIDDEWYRVDLLFFHRRLRCLVIFDLKLGRFTHADASFVGDADAEHTVRRKRGGRLRSVEAVVEMDHLKAALTEHERHLGLQGRVADGLRSRQSRDRRLARQRLRNLWPVARQCPDCGPQP